MSLATPVVMGILNVTPDSFYAGSRSQTEREIIRRGREIQEQGGGIIDVGAFSTRPGAPVVSEEEETERLRRGLSAVRREFPDAVLSVDTFRPDVARMAVEEYGVAIVNDVSGGNEAGAFGGTEAVSGLPHAGDAIPPMFAMAGRLGVPYILMSVCSALPEMIKTFAAGKLMLHAAGVKDVILDPGFGFGKTAEQNYAILAQMDRLLELGLPVLAGVSRKSMIFRTLGITPDEALNGTTVLNTMALERGVSILRVHDVKEAVEAVRLTECLRGAMKSK